MLLVSGQPVVGDAAAASWGIIFQLTRFALIQPCNKTSNQKRSNLKTVCEKATRYFLATSEPLFALYRINLTGCVAAARWQGAGGSRQGAVGSRQEAGGRRQQAGGSRQDAAGRRQEAAGRTQQAGGRRQEATDRGQEAAGSRQEAAGSRQQTGGPKSTFICEK